MIKLKNGYTIDYTEDFDQFFRNLLEAIITQSRYAADKKAETEPDESSHDMFLRELMDNCIFVTHQLFEISEENEDFSRFMVTGFIFNSIILTLPHLDKDTATEDDPPGKDNIH